MAEDTTPEAMAGDDTAAGARSERFRLRFCWRCVWSTLALLALIGGVGWYVAQQVDAARREAALTTAGLVEVIDDLETANGVLRADLEAAEEELAAARAAALAAPGGGLEALEARAAALPEPERRALALQLLGEEGRTAEDARRNLARLSQDERAALFAGLPDVAIFKAWFESMERDGRLNWVRRLPGLSEIDAKPISATPEDAPEGAPAAPLLRDAAAPAGEGSELAATRIAAAEEAAEALRADLTRAAEARDLAEQARAAALERAATLELAFEARGEAAEAARLRAETAEAAAQTAETARAAAAAERDRLRAEQAALVEARRTLEARLARAEVQVAAARQARSEKGAAASDGVAAGADPTTAAIETGPPARGVTTPVPDNALQERLETAETRESALAARLEEATAREAALSERLTEAGAREAGLSAALAEARAAADAADARARALEAELSAAQTARLSAELAATEARAAAMRVETRATPTARPASAARPTPTATLVGPPIGLAPRVERLSAGPAFRSGSAELNAAGRAAVDRFARTLLTRMASDADPSWRLRVVGHTDWVPIRTRAFPSNWALSAQRAAAVTARLVDRGVPAARLYAVGRADQDPVVEGRGPRANARNRRIEFDLVRLAPTSGE